MLIIFVCGPLLRLKMWTLVTQFWKWTLYQVGYQEVPRKPVEFQDKGYILVNQ